MREAAAKEGRYLSVADAYKAAVANDVASGESKIMKAKDAVKAKASRAADSDVQDIGPNHGTTRSVSRTAKSAEDVASMTREERKAFFDKLGDTPIR
jgi:hypothetical protein